MLILRTVRKSVPKKRKREAALPFFRNSMMQSKMAVGHDSQKLRHLFRVGHDIHDNTAVVAVGGSFDYRANRICDLAALADDFSHIVGGDRKLEELGIPFLTFGHDDAVGIIDNRARNIRQNLFHHILLLRTEIKGLRSS